MPVALNLLREQHALPARGGAVFQSQVRDDVGFGEVGGSEVADATIACEHRLHVVFVQVRFLVRPILALGVPRVWSARQRQQHLPVVLSSGEGEAFVFGVLAWRTGGQQALSIRRRLDRLSHCREQAALVHIRAHVLAIRPAHGLDRTFNGDVLPLVEAVRVGGKEPRRLVNLPAEFVIGGSTPVKLVEDTAGLLLGRIALANGLCHVGAVASTPQHLLLQLHLVLTEVFPDLIGGDLLALLLCQPVVDAGPLDLVRGQAGVLQRHAELAGGHRPTHLLANPPLQPRVEAQFVLVDLLQHAAEQGTWIVTPIRAGVARGVLDLRAVKHGVHSRGLAARLGVVVVDDVRDDDAVVAGIPGPLYGVHRPRP